MQLKNLFLPFFLCCILSDGFAQHHSPIDSLRKLLPSLTGIERVDCLNELSNQYLPIYSITWSIPSSLVAKDSSRYFASEAYREAMKITYAHGIAEALSNLAHVEESLDNFVEEERYAEEGLMWFRKTDNKKRLAETHLHLAWALYASSKFGDAIRHYDSAYLIYQSHKDTATMTQILGLMAQVYLEGGNYDKAFEISREGLMQATRIKDEKMVRWHLGDIAEIYLSIGDTANCLAYYQKQFRRGLDYYKLKRNYDSAHYFLSLRDTSSQRGYRFYLTAKGDLYFSEKKYKEALESFMKAYEMHRSANDPNQAMQALDGISRAYYNLGNDLLAMKYAYECLELARQKRAKHVVRMNCYKVIYSVFDHLHKYDSAYAYFKLYTSLKDSVLSNQVKGKLAAYLPEQKVEMLEKENELQDIRMQKETVKRNVLVGGVLFFLAVAFILWRNNRYRQKAYALLQRQKLEIEDQRSKLEKTLYDLKSAQAQLIQSEKMASLGELTAGIAHEIQNPMNFVNNFSEVNTELIDELEQAVRKGNLEDAKTIINDIKENEQKINLHGKRADAIVKGMLQHSRSSSGLKEPTDINALADEYLRLAYHGLRAKDKTFNATMKTEFDATIGNVKVIPQDIGRVILNLITNAFYAVTEKRKSQPDNYQPTVTVSTAKKGDKVLISVKDNGNGIPQNALDKIFQPFFTTKPTGQGTGLGLSLSYDIVKAHGGELKVQTKEGEFAEFIVLLPIV